MENKVGNNFYLKVEKADISTCCRDEFKNVDFSLRNQHEKARGIKIILTKRIFFTVAFQVRHKKKKI